jgi:2-oxoglutarate ferredoxin oxidoreductase subunit delta
VTPVEKTVAVSKLQINREWCKGCGICVAFCPKKALFLDEKNKVAVIAAKCNGCAVCELFCPDFALVVREEGV